MSRREARDAALAFLFQLDFRSEPVSEQRDLYLQNHPLDEADIDFFDTLVQGVCEKKDEIDEVYAKYLKDWKQDRLPKVDVVILRISVYEMLYMKDVPTNVSISEAVILTKKYSSEDSKGYINAVLGKVGKELESNE
ncbi:MAG: transcription antitermination factor NusB [Clostridiales bacterium]|nr:transcription antitermination factor NusB [Clostridiales bacterium]